MIRCFRQTASVFFWSDVASSPLTAKDDLHELYNGLLYENKFTMQGNYLFRGYVELSPATNQQVKITVKTYDGAYGLFQQCIVCVCVCARARLLL
jgi:hypothetical protein